MPAFTGQDEFRHKELPALGGELRRQVQDEFRHVEMALYSVSTQINDLDEWTETHESAYNPHGKVTWKGAWTPGTYELYDFSTDGAYAGVANKQTTDRLAPQDAGSAFFVYSGTDPTSTISAKQLVVGQRYTWEQANKLNGLRLYTTAGNTYRVYSVSDPLGVPILNELVSPFIADTTEWLPLAIDPIIVAAGSVFDLYAAIEQPAVTPTAWTANYDYDTPNNPGAPPSGVCQHANNDLGQLHFHKTDDDGTDRGVALLALTPGDVIEALGLRWAIQTDPVDNGTYVTIAAAPAGQASPDGVTQFSFETVMATPITVILDSNYWLGEARASGRYQIDGGAWVDTEDQYNVDINVQPVTISDDWDLLPTGGGGGGGGEPGPPGTTLHGELTDTDTDGHPASVITDLDAAIDARIANALNDQYPIDSIVYRHDTVNPGTYLPGVWASVGAGRFVVGTGLLDSTTYLAGTTGGDLNRRVFLTEAQGPTHNHGPTVANTFVVYDGEGGQLLPTGDGGTANTRASASTTANAGDGDAHENRPPWLVLTVWRRTS